MLVGVILAGVDQVIRLDGQIGTVIDTTLLIARAILAVLYSRVIHRLRREDPTGTSQPETVQIDEAVTALITETITAAFHDLSQHLDERLTMRESKQADALAHLRQEIATMQAEAASHERDTSELKRTKPVLKARSSIEMQSKTLNVTPQREIDDIIWPLLNRGMTVRAIAEKANTSTATVGRSRKRWESATRDLGVSHGLRHETTPETVAGQASQATA
jgi:DNA-binding NarL/FixJ family response regulator